MNKKNIVISFKNAAAKLVKLYQQRRDLNVDIDTYEAKLRDLGKFIEVADQLENSYSLKTVSS